MSATADRRLPDLCANIFAFGFQIREAANLPDVPDSVRMSMISEQELVATQAAMAHESAAAAPPMDAAPAAAAAAPSATGWPAPQAEPGTGAIVREGAVPNDPLWHDADALHKHIDRLFRELDIAATRLGGDIGVPVRSPDGLVERDTSTSAQDVQLAKYALAAYLDEIILSSELPVRHAWAGRPLQLEYFNDFNAGEQFYLEIDKLRHVLDARSRDILEVYFICLTLGFRGKYVDRPGFEKRKLLIDSVGRELTASHATAIEAPSTAVPAAETPPRAWSRLPLWSVPLMCAAGMAIGFFIFTVLLDGQAEGVVEALLDR